MCPYRSWKGCLWRSSSKQETIIVDDVRQHQLYSDSRTMSEIVVPMIKGRSSSLGLDLDSECVSDYDQLDPGYLERFVLYLDR